MQLNAIYHTESHILVSHNIHTHRLLLLLLLFLSLLLTFGLTVNWLFFLQFFQVLFCGNCWAGLFTGRTPFLSPNQQRQCTAETDKQTIKSSPFCILYINAVCSLKPLNLNDVGETDASVCRHTARSALAADLRRFLRSMLLRRNN